MQKFLLLVIGENPELQLEPFIESTKNKKYLKFYNARKELKDDFETFIIKDTAYTRLKTPGGAGKTLKEYYGSLAKAFKEWYEIQKDPRVKAYGYWYNPNAKLDRYEVLHNLIDINNLDEIDSVLVDGNWLQRWEYSKQNEKNSLNSAWQELISELIEKSASRLTLIEYRL